MPLMKANAMMTHNVDQQHLIAWVRSFDIVYDQRVAVDDRHPPAPQGNASVLETCGNIIVGIEGNDQRGHLACAVLGRLRK